MARERVDVHVEVDTKTGEIRVGRLGKNLKGLGSEGKKSLSPLLDELAELKVRAGKLGTGAAKAGPVTLGQSLAGLGISAGVAAGAVVAGVGLMVGASVKLLAVASNVDRVEKSFGSISGTMGGEMAQNAIVLTNLQRQIGDSTSQLATLFAHDLAPAFATVLGHGADFLDWAVETKKSIGDLSGPLESLAFWAATAVNPATVLIWQDWNEQIDEAEGGILGVNTQLGVMDKFIKAQQAASQGVGFTSLEAIKVAQKRRKEQEKINAELAKLKALSEIEFRTHQPMQFEQSAAPGDTGIPGLGIPNNQIDTMLTERVQLYAKHLQQLAGIRERILPQQQVGEAGLFEADLSHLGVPDPATLQTQIDAADMALQGWVDRVQDRAFQLQQTLGMVQGVFSTAFQGIRAGIDAGGAQAVAAFVSMAGQILTQIGGYMVSHGSAEIAVGSSLLVPNPAMIAHGTMLVSAGSALSIAGTAATIAGGAIGAFGGRGAGQGQGFGGFDFAQPNGPQQFDLSADGSGGAGETLAGLNYQLSRLTAMRSKDVLMIAAKNRPKLTGQLATNEAPA